MTKLDEILFAGEGSVVISGHVRPDGDCVGTCCALYLYMKHRAPARSISLMLERPKEALTFVPGMEDAADVWPGNENPELFITCDASSTERIGVTGDIRPISQKCLVIDHHVTNEGFGDYNFVDASSGSCAEVLYALLDKDYIDRDIATALFTGIIHDTGVFQYNNTRPVTLEIAADLMRRGAAASTIIEESFNIRTYTQQKVLGYVLSRCSMSHEGAVVTGSLSIEEREACGADLRDLDPIVAHLRFTEGIHAAVFLYETEPDIWKTSFRSDTHLDVSQIAGSFGGGGHACAAGCTLMGTLPQVKEMVHRALTEALA